MKWIASARWLAAAIVALAGIWAYALPVLAEATPKFVDFPARVYHGRNAKVLLNTPDTKMFKTRLREGARQKPNFAGHFVLVTWGCGTNCQSGAVIDVLNGRVTFLPASICCWSEDDQPFYYRADSRLIVFGGMLNEEEPRGAHFFVIEDHGFRKLGTISTEPPVAAQAEDTSTDVAQAARSGVGEVGKASPDENTQEALSDPQVLADLGNICNGRAEYISIEEGDYNPPAAIIPDLGANGETRQLEWNQLDNAQASGVTLKCYAALGTDRHTTFKLAKDIDRCWFLDGIAACSTPAQRFAAVTSAITGDPDAETLRTCLDNGLQSSMDMVASHSKGDPDFYAKVLALGGLATIGEGVRTACDSGFTERTGRPISGPTRKINDLFVAGLLDAEEDFFFRCRSHTGDDGWGETVKACAVLREKFKIVPVVKAQEE